MNELGSNRRDGGSIGLIAILVSLIYVAIQIRQNNNQLNQQSYQTWVAANMGLNMATLDPARAEMLEVDPIDWTVWQRS